jgi:hypothetical protein
MSDVSVEYKTEDNLYRLDWVHLDEGWYGDYNADDPNDERLLRFDIYVWDNELGEWNGEIQDTSYCTQLNVNTSKDDLFMIGSHIVESFADAWDNGCGWKRTLEECTWLTPADFAK